MGSPFIVEGKQECSVTYFSFIYPRYAIVQAHSVWTNMLVVKINLDTSVSSQKL